MDRRDFLRAIAIACAAVVGDPERLLWVPGQKRIFIPDSVAVRPSWLPPGWLVADGRALSRAVYPELHAVLGTAYGHGGSDETFRVPDLGARFYMMKDTPTFLPPPPVVPIKYGILAEPRSSLVPVGFIAAFQDRVLR